MRTPTHPAPRSREARPPAVPADFPVDRVASRFADMPEKRLMLAVLLDAIIQLRRPGSTGAIEAAAWFVGASDEPFAFRAVCDALGLDPAYLSRGVFAWARRQAAAEPWCATPLRRPQTRALHVSARRRRQRSLAAV
jgi:hypothetical protein